VNTSKPAFVGASRAVDRGNVTRYLVEYESVQEFPPPPKKKEVIQTTASQTTNAQPQRQRKKQTSYPVLSPKRVTDDSVLKIRHVYLQRQPRAVTQQSMTRWSYQFDPNTVWIEMLIYEQQRQNLSAARKQLNLALQPQQQ
jgi:hypothetical protein